ncbi:hypothetical protein ACU3L3_06945 [Priestia endophytica]
MKTSYSIRMVLENGLQPTMTVTKREGKGLQEVIERQIERVNKHYPEALKIILVKEIKPDGELFFHEAETTTVWEREVEEVKEEETLEMVLEKIVEDRVNRIMEPIEKIANKYTRKEIKELYNQNKINSQMMTDALNADRTRRIIHRNVKVDAQKIQNKVQNQLGKIKHAHLNINQRGGFDGVIEGEKATANINTVLAGGCIQKAHYRTLIKVKGGSK